MANPQKEDGHTQIANEILEALVKSGINGVEFAVVLCVIRKTYGWNKKEDEISLSQFSVTTGYSRRAICKAVKQLQLVNILSLVNKGSSVKSSNKYRLNKDYDSWRLVNKEKLVNKPARTSEQTGKQLVNKELHTKDNIQKTITKDILTNVNTEQAPNYGNQEINLTLSFLKQKIEVDDFKESQRQQRMWGKHILVLAKKIGKEEFGVRLGALLDDDFTAKNCNSLRFVYRNLKAYKAPTLSSNIAKA